VLKGLVLSTNQQRCLLNQFENNAKKAMGDPNELQVKYKRG